MGLAGPRNKQRISADPNNLHWSRDTNKFGYKMLANMGWVPGKGLGLNENGDQEHVKIRLKENNYGVGANRKNVDNWLENSSAFTRLLQDLNERIDNDKDGNESEEELPRKKAKNEIPNREDLPKKKAKKDMPSEENEKGVEDVAEMKMNIEVKEKKKVKKARRVARKELQVEPESAEGNSKPSVAIRSASRAKFLRNKRLATTQSADRLNEILGIRSDSSTSVVAETVFLPLASGEKEYKETVSDTGVQLKVNTMSTQDYFAIRMKGLKLSGIVSSGLAAVTSSSVNLGDDEDSRPSFGLGFSNSTGFETPGLPSSSISATGLEASNEKQGDLANENTEHLKVKTKIKTKLGENQENEHKSTKKKKSKKTNKKGEQINKDCNDKDREEKR